MAAELKGTFLAQYGQCFNFTDIKKNTLLPFKDHPQFPVLVDILSRKNHHHAALCVDFPISLHTIFMEAFLHYLAREHVPNSLKEPELLVLNLEDSLFNDIKQSAIEKDFKVLRDTIDKSNQYFLILINRVDLFLKDTPLSNHILRKQIDSLLVHPHCRCLLFINSQTSSPHHQLTEQFTYLSITPPSETDIMTLLKQQRKELEDFHQVLIPEELLSQAFLFSERYLSTDQTLEKTLLLLDSSAARASNSDIKNDSSSFKPVLTTSILLNVLSDWTQIPSTHLQINKFKHNDFVQNLQQLVFGQETAITILGHELLQAQARLQAKNSPFGSFLFAGPHHTGKKTMARALTEQLFKQLNVLFFAQSPLTHQTLSDVKLQRCSDKQFFPLTEVIRQTPYAVIFFNDVDKFSLSMREGLQEILTTGYLHDLQGHQYNFRQSIIMMSTTVGTHSLTQFAEELTQDDDIYTMDLMQLVLSDKKQTTHHPSHHYSTQEIIEKIMPNIVETFSLPLYQHSHIVPFLPLNKTAIEKIIRLKLKTLGKQLDARYGIELGYAPEVIRFLTNEVLTKKDIDDQTDPEHALKQLYFCVEQAVLNNAENKQRSNQLFLQLNETGHLLRCDWLAVTAARQHTN